MIGDAYFQLRAQVGTGLFSLLRLAAESGAKEETEAALRGMQSRLRETFTFAALGSAGAGKSTMLNALFGREFCGAAVEPATTGHVAVFQHGDEAHDRTISGDVIECDRPHIFLRDFTVIEAPGSVAAGTLAPLLARADLVFYVLSATRSTSEIWDSLPRLGRDLLKRLVFVVWQCDRVSAEEGAASVKRLRQAMLRNLAQACPIFTGSQIDSAGRDKLERWIESEVILSEARRVRLREINEVARETMREIVAKPRAERLALDREIEEVRQRRGELDDCQEQSHRHVAGALWTLAQSFDGLRRGGEYLLRTQLRLVDLFWKRAAPPREFAQEIEAQVHASFTLQLHDQLIAIEGELQDSAAEQLRGRDRARGKTGPSKMPEFPRAALEETLAALDIPLDAAGVVDEAFTAAVRLLQLPALAAAGALAVAAGAALAGRPSAILAGLAGGACIFAALLAYLLRRNVIAGFGRHFTANRGTLLAALEPALRSAAERFYAGFAPALEDRAGELDAERRHGEPLLAQLRQIEETFARLETDLRTGLARGQPSGEP